MIRKAGGVDGVHWWVPAVNLGLQGFRGGGKDRFGQAIVLGQQELFNADDVLFEGEDILDVDQQRLGQIARQETETLVLPIQEMAWLYLSFEGISTGYASHVSPPFAPVGSERPGLFRCR